MTKKTTEDTKPAILPTAPELPDASAAVAAADEPIIETATSSRLADVPVQTESMDKVVKAAVQDKTAKPEKTKRSRRPFRQLADQAINYGILLVLLLALSGTIYLAQGGKMPPIVRDIQQSITDARSRRKLAAEKRQSDELFRTYLLKTASSQGRYAAEEYTGTLDQPGGPAATGKLVFDVQKKQADESIDINCSARIGSNGFGALNLTVQTSDNVIYSRLNDLTGSLMLINDTIVSPGEVLSDVKGQWFKVGTDASSSLPQVQDGMVLLDSGVIAPGKDTGKLVDALLSHKVFDYGTYTQKDGDNYVFDVKVSRDAYLAAVRQALPSYPKADLAVQALFDNEAGEADIRLTIAPDGSFVSQERGGQDFCTPLIQLYFGSDAQPSADLTNQKVTARPYGSLSIPPVGSSKAAAGTSLTL